MWKKLSMAYVKVHTHPHGETGENNIKIHHDSHYLTGYETRLPPKYKQGKKKLLCNTRYSFGILSINVITYFCN
jgi:hypothetical protein